MVIGRLLRRDRSSTPDREPEGPTAADLAGAGWLLPRALDPGAARARGRWTLVGTIASPTASAVDEAGAVDGGHWVLDWWVGADDRWHLPAREPSVRQTVREGAPVVETVVRVPGGDAVHRVYGVRPGGGPEHVVVEVENRTSIPFAFALVVRPVGLAARSGGVRSIIVEPAGYDPSRTAPHVVRVDGAPAVLVPRRPARMAVGDREAGDLVEVVTSGEAAEELVAASCADGWATAALVFPLTHTATFRAFLPVAAGPGDPASLPADVPDADAVSAGWEAQAAAVRVVVPEPRVATAFDAARRSVLLADDGDEAVDPGGRTGGATDRLAAPLLLGALDELGRGDDVERILRHWADDLAGSEAEAAAPSVVAALGVHWSLARPTPEAAEPLLPLVAASLEWLDRAVRRGKVPAPTAVLAADGAGRLGRALERLGQAPAAAEVARLAERLAERAGRAEPTDDARTRLGDVLGQVHRRDPQAPAALRSVLRTVGPTGAWPGPGPVDERLGHDLAASAALVRVVRALLVDDRGDGLDLLPVFADGWYGGGIEVHDLPTAHGRLSYAIRWHDTRPALLWDLEPVGGEGPVVLRVPGLDPRWSTAERRGDALLAEVAPPEGLDTLRIVAEHPDIDPAMRRPGEEPDPDQPGPDRPDLDDGGSFS